MKVGELSISWRYNGPAMKVPIIKKGRVVGVKDAIDPVEAICTVMIGENVVAVGEAHRNPKDRPSKVKARLLSLYRALKKLYPTTGPSRDKDQRRLVWLAYAALSPKRAGWERDLGKKSKPLA